MPTPPFIAAQQPDPSVGRRYAKAFKYVFAMLRRGEDMTVVDPNGVASSLIDEGRFVSLTMPRELQLRGPFATVVTPMQDGGKVIESRGHVLRLVTISGTTGFLPPSSATGARPQQGRLVPNVPDIDSQLGAVSGYMTFRRLRYLFDLYGDERRRGNIDVAMYFFDYKNDDFWRIEPQSFNMSRSSRKPMSYDYTIPFQLIERADVLLGREETSSSVSATAPLTVSNARMNTGNTGVLSKLAGALSSASKSSILTTISRFGDMVTSGLNFLRFCDAVVQRAFQSTLNKLDDVIGVFANVHDTFFTLLDIVPTLMAQLSSSLAGLFDTIHKFAPDNIAQEINDWALEVTRLSDHMAVQVNRIVASQPQRDVRDTDQRFSQGRAKFGSTTDLMQEPVGGSGSPDANPFIGSSGLSLVTDVDGLASSMQYVTVCINHGEDIYSLARRVLGNVEKFSDIVLLNKLEFPFIVADVSSKPSNTLAWGEYALVPAPVGATSVFTDSGSQAPPTASGIVDTSALPNQLADSTANWLPDQWVGYSVTIDTSGARQTLVCQTNTQNQLTLNNSWVITIMPGATTYTIDYVQFDPRRPVTPETRAYGVDMLTVFGSDGRCDIALDATKDFAKVRGLDNLFQAITLRARCPLGEHSFHKSYGLIAPVGRPLTDDVGALYSFFIRRSLLSDPRVQKVRNVQFNLEGDVLIVSAEVQPVDTRTAQPITIRVGG